MRIPTDELAELQAEHDWLIWKCEENKKFRKKGDSEFNYNEDPSEKKKDKTRLSELKKILKNLKKCK